MKRLFSITLLAVLALSMPIQAARRYSCDFETEVARARWKLNPTANQNIYNQLTNKWYIGAPGDNDKNGEYGLYISDDGGQTAHYTNKGCWVFAYDTVTLDHLESGDYTIFFDYTAMGNVASDFDGLYLVWAPVLDTDGDTIPINSIAFSSGQIPGAYEDYIIRLQPTANMDYLSGTATWKQCVATRCRSRAVWWIISISPTIRNAMHLPT